MFPLLLLEYPKGVDCCFASDNSDEPFGQELLGRVRIRTVPAR